MLAERRRPRLSRRKRPVILVAPIRSGSTTMERVLAPYLKETHGLEYEFNPLDVWTKSYSTEGGWTSRDHREKFSSPDAFRGIIDSRVKFLREKHGSIFFKVHPNHFVRDAFEHLVNDYDWIVLTRDHLLDQFCSAAVADHFRLWHPAGPVTVDPFSVSRSDFDAFAWGILRFNELLRLKKRYVSIRFEDMIRGDYSSMKEGFPGFDAYLKGSSQVTPAKGIANKLDYILNLDELRDWYRASPLNLLYEI